MKRLAMLVLAATIAGGAAGTASAGSGKAWSDISYATSRLGTVADATARSQADQLLNRARGSLADKDWSAAQAYATDARNIIDARN